jgi:hypothetical protein
MQQSDDHANPREQQRALVFKKARKHLHPGPFFRFVTYLYGERKIAVFMLMHAVCTLVVWGKLQHIDLLNRKTRSRACCFLSLHSPLCNDQRRINSTIPSGRRPLFLGKANPTSVGLWFETCHPFPDGLDSPHNGTVLHRFAFRDGNGSLHSSGQSNAHSCVPWLQYDFSCPLCYRCSRRFLRILMPSQ